MAADARSRSPTPRASSRWCSNRKASNPCHSRASRLLGGSHRSDRLLEILETELQLVPVELLRAAKQRSPD